jgi:hypothetical protein
MKIVFKALSCIVFVSLLSCKSNTVGPKLNNVTTKTQITTREQDSLAFLLCQIYGSDQGIRDSNLKLKDFKFIQEIDTLNFNKIVSFVKQHGFPTKKLLGESNYKNECVEACFTAVLLHNPHRLVNENEYFNLFLNEVKKNNIKPEYLASILDKYYWIKSKNKKMGRVLYGSGFGKPCIQTKESTNKARLEIGLKPLKDEEFVNCEGEELDTLKIRR